jgi:hypothetical protein
MPDHKATPNKINARPCSGCKAITTRPVKTLMQVE